MNPRLAEFLDLPMELTRPGTSLREVIGLLVRLIADYLVDPGRGPRATRKARD